MTAETNLQKILRTLNPELSPETYVFCQVDEETGGVLAAKSLGLFREGGGVTLILLQEVAVENDLRFDFVFRKITLRVHSSLAAVGLLAEVSRVLAEAEIAVNVVSGFNHDHLFVFEKDGGPALESLRKLSRRAKNRD